MSDNTRAFVLGFLDGFHTSAMAACDAVADVAAWLLEPVRDAVDDES